MRISSRNKLKGTVINIAKGDINSEIETYLGNSMTLVGVITTKSLEEMDLRTGDEITALIKASSITFMKE